MNKKAMLMWIIFVCFFNIIRVNADEKCLRTTLDNAAIFSKNINIQYEYIEDNDYSVLVTGLSDKIYVYEEDTNSYFYYDNARKIPDGLRMKNFHGGYSYTFNVYSVDKNCLGQRVRIITLNIPRFNYYSTHHLCKGIEDYYLCAKFSNINISQEEFGNKVKHYLDDNGRTIIEQNNEKEVNNIFTKIIDFTFDNYLYILLSIIFVCSTLIVIILKKKKTVI